MSDPIKTTVRTNCNRTLQVTDYSFSNEVYLKVSNHSKTQEISSVLTPEEAKTLAGALLSNNVAVITDLPEAKLNPWETRVYSGDVDRTAHSDPASIEETAKNLLAIAKFIRKANAEKQAAAKAKDEAAKAEQKAKEEAEAKLTARRDKLAQELTGLPFVTYGTRISTLRRAIDRIIELEDFGAAPKLTFQL